MRPPCPHSTLVPPDGKPAFRLQRRPTGRVTAGPGGRWPRPATGRPPASARRCRRHARPSTARSADPAPAARWGARGRDVGDARLDPLAMLAPVAADDLDLHELHREARRGLAPVAASNRQRIDRVDDDRVADAQIVLARSRAARYPSGPDTSKPTFRIACSIVSMRRCTAPIRRRATSRGSICPRPADRPGRSAPPTPVRGRAAVRHGVMLHRAPLAMIAPCLARCGSVVRGGSVRGGSALWRSQRSRRQRRSRRRRRACCAAR